MKLMKRILAIVCTFVMIISMATGVNAVDGSSTTSATGSITLKGAVVGDTYNVYKILSLESYDKGNNVYSYKKNGDKWDKFFSEGKGADYFTTSDNYVTLKKNVKGDEVRMLAISAIDFAHANVVKPIQTIEAKTDTVVFSGLELGYYVVESTSGTACAITTTDPNVEINNKIDTPTVDKSIISGGSISEDNKMNSVNIGEKVEFKTTINVQPGAKNYVLHDSMDSHLQFNSVKKVYYKDEINGEIDLTDQSVNPNDSDFVVTQAGLSDNCTFELKFTNKFYSTNKEAINTKKIKQIYVEYSATVKDGALINEAMKNTTHLTYGDNNLKTNDSETKTYTYKIQVFKFTGSNKGLAGAKFILLNKQDDDDSAAIKFNLVDNTYTYAANQESDKAATTLVSPAGGHFTIKGLKAGVYYLKEIEAPKGYNKISAPIEIEIRTNDEDKQTILVDHKEVEDGEVKVKNNSGSLLPSTGGMGTTLIYVVGSILVLASGIVLFSKKKEGSN